MRLLRHRVGRRGTWAPRGGGANWDARCDFSLSCDKTGATYKLFGGYNLNQNFGVEAAYVSLGKNQATYRAIVDGQAAVTHRTEKASGWELTGVYRVPFGQQWNVFGKLGLSSMKSESAFVFDTSSTLIPTVPEKRNGVRPLVGLGASYNLNARLTARAEWETRKVERADPFPFATGKDRVNSFTAGLQYNF